MQRNKLNSSTSRNICEGRWGPILRLKALPHQLSKVRNVVQKTLTRCLLDPCTFDPRKRWLAVLSVAILTVCYKLNICMFLNWYVRLTLSGESATFKHWLLYIIQTFNCCTITQGLMFRGLQDLTERLRISGHDEFKVSSRNDHLDTLNLCRVVS